MVAGDSRAEKEMFQWATSRAPKAMRRVDAFSAREVLQYSSDEEYADDEWAGKEETIDPVEALVPTSSQFLVSCALSRKRDGLIAPCFSDAGASESSVPEAPPLRAC